MSAFFALHRDLPREGPGTAEDVLWALDVDGTDANARICDAACGPGADLVTLRKARLNAALTGIDKQAHFVAAAQARVPTADVRQGDMAEIGGPFDLIWCAGALYFLGVTEGLTTWRAALAPGGRVAFSEPAFLRANPSSEARAFWAEYPAITDAGGVAERVSAAGFRTLATRWIIGEGWDAYYAPMEARIAALRANGVSDDVEAALQEGEAEIAGWRAAKGEIAYLLSIVAPA